jgi:hypothetical protein
MKKTNLALLVAMGLGTLTLSSAANAGLSSNIGVVSEYHYRSIQ